MWFSFVIRDDQLVLVGHHVACRGEILARTDPGARPDLAPIFTARPGTATSACTSVTGWRLLESSSAPAPFGLERHWLAAHAGMAWSPAPQNAPQTPERR